MWLLFQTGPSSFWIESVSEMQLEDFSLSKAHTPRAMLQTVFQMQRKQNPHGYTLKGSVALIITSTYACSNITGSMWYFA